MQTDTFDSRVWQLFGYEVLDSRGDKIGPVDKVWADRASGSLTFIGLKTGRFWGHTHVIPAGYAKVDDKAHSIRVGYPMDKIQGAPSHNTDVPLTADQESQVYSYYDG